MANSHRTPFKDDSDTAIRFHRDGTREWDKDEVDFLRRLDVALEKFLDINPGMSANQVRMILKVAINRGILQAELVEKLGMKESAVSKNISYWMGRFKHADKNHQVPEAIDVRPNMENRRLNELFLNAVGEHIIEGILKAASPAKAKD